MSNIASTQKSTWTQGKFKLLFQLMVIFTVGLALALVGCGDDDGEPKPIVEDAITVDGREVVVLHGDLL